MRKPIITFSEGPRTAKRFLVEYVVNTPIGKTYATADLPASPWEITKANQVTSSCYNRIKETVKDIAKSRGFAFKCISTIKVIEDLSVWRENPGCIYNERTLISYR